MLVDGGFIVIGADSQGHPTGRFTEDQAKLFDEATLRAKLAKWIPEPFDLKVGVHHHGGNLLAVVYVGPNPKGCCIFKADGQYLKNGKQVPAFRACDIFIRHGTASERAQQHDLDRIFARAEQIWAFTRLVVEQLRRGDEIPVRLLTDQMWRDAATLVRTGEGNELGCAA
jgi:hypothetical protein